ncbi:LOW QUALITY PROTEIN: ATP-binding cassette sub-family C member 10 [Synchiropus picturatus]
MKASWPAELVAGLCCSDPQDPVPLWQDGHVGACFNQLVLGALPHAGMAVFSAYYLAMPRGGLRTSSPPCGWRLRLASSLLLLLLFTADVVLVSVLQQPDVYLDVLADAVAMLAWSVHLGAVVVLQRSVLRRRRGPSLLPSLVLLSAANLIITLVNFSVETELSPNSPLRLTRFVLACCRTLPLLIYLVAFVFPCATEAGFSLHVNAADGSPLLPDLSRPDTGEMVAEDGSGCVSRLFYLWLSPLLRRGRRGELNKAANVYHLPWKLRTSVVCRVFQECWETCRGRPAVERNTDPWPAPVCSSQRRPEALELQGDVSLLKVLHRAFGLRFYSLGLLKLAVNLLRFAGPLLLSTLVSFMEDAAAPASRGLLCTLGLFASSLLSSVLQNVFTFQLSKVALSARAALVSAIYSKSLRVGAGGLAGFTLGEVVNLMSTDTERTVNFVNSFHELWSMPFQFAIALYLLYLQVGVAFLGGLAVALLLVPFNKLLAARILGNNEEMLKHKDRRVKLMTEVLFGIRVIKFYNWESHFAEKVSECRRKELSHLKAIKYLDALCVYTWAALPVVISILTFLTYVLLGHELTAPKVFTTLALVGMLIVPLNAFPWVLNGILEAKVSLERIQRFFKLQHQDLQAYYALVSPEDAAVLLSQGSFSWLGSHDGDDDDVAAKGSLGLHGLNLLVTKGSLVAVVGKVGCGKSSLLAALTGDLTRRSGVVYVADQDSGFGLASQEPWIQHASVRDNILFGKAMDPAFYQAVIDACALSDDLSVLPSGDRTEVGENGVTLSGGQKARVALARAAYMDKDIYLLDDPLAAVDADVARHLMQRCILDLLHGKTRILCTHRLELLDGADLVVLMEDGTIVRTGTPAEILPLVRAAPPRARESSSTGTEGLEDEERSSSSQLPVDDGADPPGEEQKQQGGLDWKVYRTYWVSVGGVMAWSVLVSLLLMQASKNVSDWWLSYWVSQLQHNSSSVTSSPPAPLLLLLSPVSSVQSWPNLSSDVQFYLSVYASLAVTNTVFTAARAFLFAHGAICAARTIHDRLLDRVLEATVSFFDVTPLGRILNRFSSDLYSVDDSLPFILNILLANACGLLGTLLVLGLGLPWVLLPLLPLALLYHRTQLFYRHTSRELKRLCSLTLSPVYAHFSETLTGLGTIRASRSCGRFEDENARRLEQNQRCLFLSAAAMQWLDIRLQLIGVAMVTGLAVIAVVQHQFGSVDPGLVGLALSYSLSVTSLLSGLIFSFTQTEMQLVSVERTEEYSSGLPTEPRSHDPQVGGCERPSGQGTDPSRFSLVGPQLPPSWPEQGRLDFCDVVLVYRDGLPNALDGVSLALRPGEKVGIVGRTGSGKSSLFQALFRMVELNGGRILLDGVDIGGVGLAQLRSRLAIIPQDPFLFSGTIRENLDPCSRHEDQQLQDVLEQCHLSAVVQRMGGLDVQVGDRGRLFSVGQRQLLCLARALLTQAKILCIDEATASVDQETDKLLQRTIRETFQDKTVLTIAHRINTIMDCDRVLVMHAGKVLEFDSPSALCQSHDSHFQRLVGDTNHCGQ